MYTELFANGNNCVYNDDMSIRTTSTLLTRQEAAQRLQVSERRISALCEAGDLVAFTDGRKGVLITDDSVLRCARWTGTAGRPYSERMAFAALYMISDEPAPWISPQQRYRLRGYLQDIDAENLTRLTRRRAKTSEYWCRDSMRKKAEEMIRACAATGELADEFQLARTGLVEGYVLADRYEQLVRNCRLKQGAAPVGVRLRVADFIPDGQGPMPIGVCAADLAESTDPRERRAGLTKLSELLARFNRIDLTM